MTLNLVPAVCPKCGADLEFPEGLPIGHCMYCGSKIILIDSDNQSSKPVIACPECKGKGYFLCEEELNIPSSEHLFTNEILPKYKNKIIEISGNWESTSFMRATGCNGSGKCHSQYIFKWHKDDPIREDGSEKLGCLPPIANFNWCKGGMCVACQGSGEAGILFKSKCEKCKGTGHCLLCASTGVCTICGGSGKIKCEACAGSGFKVYKGI
ncbi:MAG: hypothetical protein HZB92_09145 [Euryarchaeota archaeon]|nr:hypothetical protein [Euryarchaeota archaeon]